MAAIARLGKVAHHGCPEEVPKQGCYLQLGALAFPT